MNNLNIILPKLLSDLLINLSAGFLGAAIIIPVQASKTNELRVVALMGNICLSCILFALAVILNS
jgi:hypothetical protein